MTDQVTDTESPFMTSAEVCSFLKISKFTLQRYVNADQIKYYTLPGGDRRFELDDVKAVLKAASPETERRDRMRAAVAVSSGELTATEAGDR